MTDILNFEFQFQLVTVKYVWLVWRNGYQVAFQSRTFFSPYNNYCQNRAFLKRLGTRLLSRLLRRHLNSTIRWLWIQFWKANASVMMVTQVSFSSYFFSIFLLNDAIKGRLLSVSLFSAYKTITVCGNTDFSIWVFSY